MKHLTGLLALFLLCAAMSTGQPPTMPSSGGLPPDIAGKLLASAKGVYLVQPEGQNEREMEYDVVEVLAGRRPWFGLEAPPPSFPASPSDTFLLIQTPSVRERQKANRKLAKYGLPLRELTSGEFARVRDVNLSGVAVILEALKKKKAAPQHLLELATSSPDPWVRGAAESAWWTRAILRWADADSTQITNEAVELLTLPVSPGLQEAASSLVTRFPTPEAHKLLAGVIDTMSLTGAAADPDGAAVYRYQTLAIWKDTETGAIFWNRIARALENGELISPSIAKICIEHEGFADALDREMLSREILESVSLPEPGSGGMIDQLSIYELQTMLLLAARLHEDEIAQVLVALTDRLLVGGVQMTYEGASEYLASSIQLLAMQTSGESADRTVSTLTRLLDSNDLKRAGWTRAVITALGGIEEQSAVESLIDLASKGVRERYCMVTLAGMKSSMAWRFVIDKARAEIANLLALGDDVQLNSIAALKTGAH